MLSTKGRRDNRRNRRHVCRQAVIRAWVKSVVQSVSLKAQHVLLTLFLSSSSSVELWIAVTAAFSDGYVFTLQIPLLISKAVVCTAPTHYHSQAGLNTINFALFLPHVLATWAYEHLKPPVLVIAAYLACCAMVSNCEGPGRRVGVDGCKHPSAPGNHRLMLVYCSSAAAVSSWATAVQVLQFLSNVSSDSRTELKALQRNPFVCSVSGMSP